MQVASIQQPVFGLPLAGSVYEAGQTIVTNWISDDDTFNVVNVDIELSTDGGATWTVIAHRNPR